VIISRVSDSLVVRTTPGAWVDQFLPEGAAPKRQFFTDEATKRFFIIAPTLLLAGKSAFWPATFATEVIAWGVIGKKRKALITRTEKFVTEVIQGGESHFLSDRRML
jgi:hypothetical protein